MSKESLFLGGSIVGLSCLGVFAILAIVFIHPNNSDQVILQLITILSPTLIALVGAFKSIETKKEVVDLKSTVIGNTDYLENLTSQINNVKTTATIAAQTAIKLSDKVDKLNGA